MRGGTILGQGRSGTFVYTLDDLGSMNPDIQTACIERVDGKCDPLPVTSSTLRGGHKQEDIAVKHIPNVYSATKDAARSGIIRQAFSEDPKLLSLTILHPVYTVIHLTMTPTIFPYPVTSTTTNSDSYQHDPLPLLGSSGKKAGGGGGSSGARRSGASRHGLNHRQKAAASDEEPVRLPARSAAEREDAGTTDSVAMFRQEQQRLTLLPIHRIHLVYRRVEGSLSNAALIGIFDERIFRRLTDAVLSFLGQLHAHQFLHLDIKPSNIGYTVGSSSKRRRGTTPPSSQHLLPSSSSVQFMVGDYGLVTRMDRVFSDLRKHGTYHTGTRGYISPLLVPIVHDSCNRWVHHKFDDVMRAGSVDLGSKWTPLYQERAKQDEQQRDGDKKGSAVRAFWDEYFSHYARKMLSLPSPSFLAKVDLHSLALTLYDLIPDHRRAAALRDGDGIIPRLMFFRKHDLYDARIALHELRVCGAVFRGNKLDNNHRDDNEDDNGQR